MEAITEVETQKLLSDLSAVAAKLNSESDSVNEILDGFEEKLCDLNIGLEAWVTISTEEQSVTLRDGDDVPGSVDVQLGWVKDDEWGLVTRTVAYRGDLLDNDNGLQEWQEIERSAQQEIRLASREVRIEALEALPRLLEQLKERAEAAVKKIERAKKLVKSKK